MSPGLARLFGVLVGAAFGAGLGAMVLLSVREESTAGLLAAAVATVVFTVAMYAAANSGAKKAREDEGGELFRTALIGMNGALNVALLMLFLPAIVAAVIGTIPMLAASVTISKSEIYQGILGWINWLLPTSWPIVGLGLAFAVVNFLGTLVTFFLVQSWRVSMLPPAWATGTLFFKAGWLANLNNRDTAFNMGNFTFVDVKSSSDHRVHESAHSLNLAAFGWIFHLVGFVDEIILNNGSSAYSERLADKIVPMWA